MGAMMFQAERLKYERMLQGLTAYDFEPTISHRYIYKLESNQRPNPSFNLVFKVASSLGIPVAKLTRPLSEAEKREMPELKKSMSRVVRNRRGRPPKYSK
jgi:transcriptional regulator with XRE-family HTH domain